MLTIILYVIALGLMVAGAAGLNVGRWSLGWLGLALAWFTHALLPILA